MHLTRRFAIAMLTFAALIPPFAFAGQGQTGNAAPFGLELGNATYAQVKKAVSSATDAGTNAYSGGRMLRSDGSDLDVDGLQNVVFIFDKSDVLVGAVFTMNKDPKNMFKLLSTKYKVVSNHIDTFMNNGTARLEKGNSFIDIDAPHMSFEMKVSYVTKTLNAAFNKSVNDEASEKQKKKVNAL